MHVGTKTRPAARAVPCRGSRSRVAALVTGQPPGHRVGHCHLAGINSRAAGSVAMARIRPMKVDSLTTDPVTLIITVTLNLFQGLTFIGR